MPMPDIRIKTGKEFHSLIKKLIGYKLLEENTLALLPKEVSEERLTLFYIRKCY